MAVHAARSAVTNCYQRPRLPHRVCMKNPPAALRRPGDTLRRLGRRRVPSKQDRLAQPHRNVTGALLPFRYQLPPIRVFDFP